DLAHDVADFFTRCRSLEFGELREVDGVDQGVEDGRLDVIVLLGMPPLCFNGFDPRCWLRLRCRCLLLRCAALRIRLLRRDGWAGRSDRLLWCAEAGRIVGATTEHE